MSSTKQVPKKVDTRVNAKNAGVNTLKLMIEQNPSLNIILVKREKPLDKGINLAKKVLLQLTTTEEVINIEVSIGNTE